MMPGFRNGWGQLPVQDLEYFKSVYFGFSWIQTFMAVRAIKKYRLKVDSVPVLALQATLHGLSIADLKGAL